MTQSQTRRLTLALLAGSLVLAGCERTPAHPQHQTQPVGESTTTPGSQPDPSGVNQAIAPEEFAQVALSLVGSPRQAVGGQNVLVTIKIRNTSTQRLVGSGLNPVNLGVQILGDDGTTSASSHGMLDFIRQPLPPTEPGTENDITIAIPVDTRTTGRELRIALVQEPLRWYDTPADKPIVIGPFSACGEQVCTAEGSPLK